MDVDLVPQKNEMQGPPLLWDTDSFKLISPAMQMHAKSLFISGEYKTLDAVAQSIIKLDTTLTVKIVLDFLKCMTSRDDDWKTERSIALQTRFELQKRDQSDLSSFISREYDSSIFAEQRKAVLIGSKVALRQLEISQEYIATTNPEEEPEKVQLNNRTFSTNIRDLNTLIGAGGKLFELQMSARGKSTRAPAIVIQNNLGTNNTVGEDDDMERPTFSSARDEAIDAQIEEIKETERSTALEPQ